MCSNLLYGQAVARPKSKLSDKGESLPSMREFLALQMPPWPQWAEQRGFTKEDFKACLAAADNSHGAEAYLLMLEQLYPPGTRVRLDKPLQDPERWDLSTGDKGVVSGYEKTANGQLLMKVKWRNGMRTALRCHAHMVARGNLRDYEKITMLVDQDLLLSRAV